MFAIVPALGTQLLMQICHLGSQTRSDWFAMCVQCEPSVMCMQCVCSVYSVCMQCVCSACAVVCMLQCVSVFFVLAVQGLQGGNGVMEWREA